MSLPYQRLPCVQHSCKDQVAVQESEKDNVSTSDDAVTNFVHLTSSASLDNTLVFYIVQQFTSPDIFHFEKLKSIWEIYLAVIATLAPCLTASMARAAPIPVLAPVTQTTCIEIEMPVFSLTNMIQETHPNNLHLQFDRDKIDVMEPYPSARHPSLFPVSPNKALTDQHHPCQQM